MTNVVKVEIRRTTPAELDEQVEWYFVGIAGNGESVVVSERYTTPVDASRGAEGVFPGIEQVNEISVREVTDGN